MTDLSAILTAHHEGPLAGVALRSLLCAVDRARGAGLDVEVLVVLDDPDDLTRDVLADGESRGWRVDTVSFGDQGLVRNHAVGLSHGAYVAFLDGDDLWSENWLLEAHALCETDPGRVIAHPEIDWFFGANNNVFFHVDQTDPEFDPHFLRVGNYWDALCLAPRRAYEDHPFAERAVAEGFAYEDWHWNFDTLDAGYLHRVAAGTVHFKRRRPDSQTMVASTSKTLTRLHRLQTWAGAAALDVGAAEEHVSKEPR